MSALHHTTRRTALIGLGGALLVAAMPAIAAPAIIEHMVDAPGARLYVTDTGGKGPVILLAHPATGSALIWEHQRVGFAAAGYRVVAWSRREHARSEVTGADPGTNADILTITKALNIGRFHFVGSAAGGGIAIQFAAAHPERLLSLTMANSISGIAEPAFKAWAEGLRPPSFNAMPAEVRELSPTYRAANPQGAARWVELEQHSRIAPLGAPPRAGVLWDDVARLPMPILWLTGDADLYVPPPLQREAGRHARRSHYAVIPGTGHSAYWEAPDLFNRAVLAFLKRP
ncbi:alpha/beta fold hydrolase [Novosphingobium sediminicola]|uniref:Pimeloyl-ACP methyl ester carboxylesterase n=1 Tax=Novosphingobium sediminicola TaxID=563162 RepID=A0A7W6CIX6_9SPHN|nr:pimeloyl-ACP methyl ester carboxylesterase [Novosphingobium sediminicola]